MMSSHAVIGKALAAILVTGLLGACASTNKDAKALLNPDPPGKMYATADAYLTKPFLPEELLIRVDAIWEQQKRLQAYYLQQSQNEKDPLLQQEQLASEQEAKFLDKVREHILENLDNVDFSVEQLSRLLFMDKSNLYRKVKALTGLSPVKLILHFRLEQAKDLVRNSHQSMLEIALSCGFSSANYFARAFKKEIGQSPSEYRSD